MSKYRSYLLAAAMATIASQAFADGLGIGRPAHPDEIAAWDVNVMPGGPSEDPSSPQYATQLGPWLTADYHKVRMTREPKVSTTGRLWPADAAPSPMSGP